MDATSNIKTATLTVGNKTYDFPILSGTVGPDVVDIAQAVRPDRDVHLRSGLHLDRRAASPRSPISTAMPACCEYRGYPIEQLAEKATSSRPAICCCTANCRPRREIRVRQPRHPPHHGARADGPVLPGLPPRRPSDGRDGGVGRRAGGVLSRLHRHQRSAAAHDRVDAHDREDADARGDGVQIHRSASPSSIRRTRSSLCRELPAYVLRGAVRGLQGQSGAGRRAGQDLHPARRPRAERLDLDGAASPAPPAPIRSPASPPASPACGARRMAAPTKRR